MAIAFRAETENLNGGGSSSIVVSKPPGVVDGDLLLVYLAWNNSGGITVSAVPSGWTLLRSSAVGTDLGVEAYYKFASSEPSTWTWTLSGSGVNGYECVSYSGCDAGTPPVASATWARISGTNITTNAVTVPTNGWFTAFFGGFDLSDRFSVPTGLTRRDGNASNQATFDSNAPDAGSITAASAGSASAATYGLGVAIAAAGGSPQSLLPGAAAGTAAAQAPTLLPGGAVLAPAAAGALATARAPIFLGGAQRDISVFIGESAGGWAMGPGSSGWRAQSPASGWIFGQPIRE